MQPCLIPVALPDALAWASGSLNDRDLVSRSPLLPQAIFLINLPDLASARPALRLMLHWWQRGAVVMIARTSNDVVDDHLIKRGFVPTLREERGNKTAYRFLGGPDQLNAWLAPLTRRSKCI